MHSVHQAHTALQGVVSPPSRFSRFITGGLWLLVTCLLLVPSTFAQQYAVRTFQDERAPLVGKTFGMLQDDRGVIWIWGNRGVVSYDGERFRRFAEPEGLPDDYTYNLRPGEDGSLLACTYDGLARINPATGHIDTVLQLQSRPVRDVVERGDDFLLATDHGLLMLRDKRLFHISTVDSATGNDRNSMVHNLYLDRDEDRLYLATDRIGLGIVEMEVVDSLFTLAGDSLGGPSSFSKRLDQPLADLAVVPSRRNFAVLNTQLMAISDREARRALWQRASSLVIVPGTTGSDGYPTWSTLDVVPYPKGKGVLVRDAYRIYRFEDGHLRPSRYSPRMTGIRIHDVTVTDDGIIGVATSSGAWIYEPGKPAWHVQRAKGLLSDHVASHLHDRQGFDWFVDRRGNLQRIASSAVNVYHVNEYHQLADIVDARIHPSGDLYLATTSGLVRLRDNSVEQLLSFSQLGGDYFGFAFDRFGRVVLTMGNGLYLLQQDGSSGQVRSLARDPIVHDGVAQYSLAPDGTLYTIYRDVLYAWDGHRLKKSQGQGFPLPLYLDASVQGRVFVGHWAWLAEINLEDGYRRWYDRDRVRDNRPYVIWDSTRQASVTPVTVYPHALRDEFAAVDGCLGPNGAYWAGTFSAGLVRIPLLSDRQMAADSLQIFDTSSGDLPTNSITQMQRLPDGRVHVLLDNHLVEITNDSLEVVDLMPSAPLDDYLEMDDGTQALATPAGLMLRREGVELVLNKGFGLPENPVASLDRFPDGRLLARQPNGVVLVDVDALPWDQKTDAIPLISNLEVAEHHVSLQNEIHLDPDNRRFQVRVALPDYFNEHQLRYRWWLEGFEESPRGFDAYDLIEYTNLPPGEYTLHLQARTSAGFTVERPSALTLVVPPRFVETAWFTVLLVTGGLILIGLVVAWWLHRQHLRAKWTLELEHEKLEMANRLAATIAHEFNNPLQIIQSTIDILRVSHPDDKQLQDLSSKVPVQVSRMKRLIKKLMHLSQLREKDYLYDQRILDLDSDTPHHPDDDSDQLR